VILLQTGGSILGTGANAGDFLTFGTAVAATAALILVGTLIARRRRARSGGDPGSYSSAVFRRTGKAIGLTHPQVEALEDLVRRSKVKQPYLVFTSPLLLDDTLRNGLYSIDGDRGLSEEDRENRRTVLFQIKQVIEGNARKGSVLGSTSFVRPGQALTVAPEGQAPFQSWVVSNMKDYLAISTPSTPTRSGRRWGRGTRLTVHLWRERDAGYTFTSKVLRYDTVKGVSSVLIQHSKTLRRRQRRRARRRELQRPCFYYPIRIMETGQGRRTERKAVVEKNQRALGTILDLSPGGCALQTLKPVEKGRLVMIEFDIDRKRLVRVFGKIMQVRQTRGRGGTLSVMFTRVTRQHLNHISEYVYDFSRPATVLQAREQVDRAVPGRGMLPTPRKR